MDIIIREAGLEDAADVVGLISEHAALSKEHSPLAINFVARYLKSPDSTILVAELKCRMIGLLRYSLRPDLYHAGDSCLIEELIVTKEARNQGAGKALMNELLSRMAGATHVVEVSVAVMHNNTQAIRFYRSQGLVEKALLLEMHLCR